MSTRETAFWGFIEWEIIETIEQRVRTLDEKEKRLAQYRGYPEEALRHPLIRRDIGSLEEEIQWLRISPLKSRLSRIGWKRFR